MSSSAPKLGYLELKSSAAESLGIGAETCKLPCRDGPVKVGLGGFVGLFRLFDLILSTLLPVEGSDVDMFS